METPVKQKLPAQKRILIIDDDKLVLQSLAALFIKNDWNVETCHDGRVGLDRLKAQKYDCILMDVRMPELDGIEVLEQIRVLEKENKLSKQNVIIFTGFADESASVDAFKMGAFNYIQKPFNIDDLLAKANECLKSSQVANTYDSLVDETTTFKKIRKNYDRDSVDKKADLLSKAVGIPLKHIKGCTYDTNYLKGNIENPIGIAQVPLGIIGPLWVEGKHAKGEFFVPMATTEGALLLTYDFGARLVKMCAPIETEVVSKYVHITPMFPIASDEDVRIGKFVDEEYANIKAVAEGGSSHTKLLRIDKRKVGDNFLLRFVYDTGDAHGLNMINQASYNACKYISSKLGFRFYHRSHYSGVKHHSLLNEKEGYGRLVRARMTVTKKALGMLTVSAQQMKDFFDRCIECGTAAGISAVNVHAANALAAIFIATGQDLADLSSSHVCATRCELANGGEDIYIECELRNLLVATVGGGTGLGTQSECLKLMNCFGTGKSDQFAEIIAATVLAGEFPTAAAVISETYVDIHNRYGRNKDKVVE